MKSIKNMCYEKGQNTKTTFSPDLRHQISIWRRAADSLQHLSRDELVVRERLERKIKKLTARLKAVVKETRLRAYPKDCYETMLADMKQKVYRYIYVASIEQRRQPS